MGRTTKIAWTGATENFWIGCHRQSPGCDHCYAETLVRDRTGRDFSKLWRTAPATFNAPLRWKQPTRIFTCSLSDFFHPGADAWRADAWEVIRRTPQHVWQILTKRPQLILERLPQTCFACGFTKESHDRGLSHDFNGWPWPNVWLGTSVENQEWADRRIPRLMQIPAKVHFLSCEPLLGPIDFSSNAASSDFMKAAGLMFKDGLLNDVEWVIVGGESGPGFRPMDLDWARQIRDQCVEAEISFFFKQQSGLRPGTDPVLDGRRWEESP